MAVGFCNGFNFQIKGMSVSIAEWVALFGFLVALIGLVGAVVYSYTKLQQEVRSMHRCQRINLKLTARHGRILKKHMLEEEKRFTKIEKHMGVSA